MKKLIAAAVALLMFPIAALALHSHHGHIATLGWRTNYPTGKQLTACLIEHEVAHAGGWAPNHPGAIHTKRCGGLIMPPHKFPLNGVTVRWHWVSKFTIFWRCGPLALACTYMSNPADIYMPLPKP